MINVINLGYITVAIIFPNAFKYALLKSGPSRYYIRTENCWHLFIILNIAPLLFINLLNADYYDLFVIVFNIYILYYLYHKARPL